MNQKKIKIYISGKITGDKDYRKKFEDAERYLTEQGYEAVNPATEPEGKQWHEYMRTDLKKLLECDAIFLLPDWTESRGACLEGTIARQLQMEFYEMHNGKMCRYN